MESFPEQAPAPQEHQDLERQERIEQAQDLLDRLRNTADYLVSLLDKSTTANYEKLIKELSEVALLLENARKNYEQLVEGTLEKNLRVPQPERSLEHHERKRSVEEYDDEVDVLMEGVMNLEGYFEMLDHQGMLDAAVMDDLHDQLDRFQEQLQELDGTTENPVASPVRKMLVGIIDDIRQRYARNQVERQAEPTLSAVRELHRTVKASYASVSHRLNEDQRRSFRVRIAQLSAMVRHAEDAEYRRLFTYPTAAREIMARARSVAPTLASAVSDIQKKKGVLATIGDALRLK